MWSTTFFIYLCMDTKGSEWGRSRISCGVRIPELLSGMFLSFRFIRSLGQRQKKTDAQVISNPSYSSSQSLNPLHLMEVEQLDLGGDILLKSLQKSGVPLPKGVSSIQTLKQTPGALFSVCARSLQQIDESFVPDYILEEEDEEEDSIVSMAQKFNVCTQMSDSFEKLGYSRGQISFHQFLYPSQDDMCNLLRFLVERLSDSDTLSKSIDAEKRPSSFTNDEDNETTTIKLRGKSEECLKKHPLSDSTNNANKNTDSSSSTSGTKNTLTINEADQFAELHGTSNIGPFLESHGNGESDEKLCINRLPLKPNSDTHASARSDSLESKDEDELQDVKIAASEQESGNCSAHASGNELSLSLRKDSYDTALDGGLVSLRATTSKMRTEIENLHSQGEMLKHELNSKALECQQLESKHELLKRAVGIAYDDQHPVDFHIEELNKKVESQKRNLQELELHCNASIKPLEDKKRSLEELLYAQKFKAQSNLPKMKEVELELEAIELELQNRDEEKLKLLVELEKQPKAATRKSYILRISEITKNSRKQDADIERILKDTRDLQIERNLLQERLHRTHMVADETMVRDSKKDPVRQQAYRLLTTIHESFAQISEKILATDRIRREVVELEAKLAAVSTHNVDIGKLQADLDTMRKENELLEKQLLHHSKAREEIR